MPNFNSLAQFGKDILCAGQIGKKPLLRAGGGGTKEGKSLNTKKHIYDPHQIYMPNFNLLTQFRKDICVGQIQNNKKNWAKNRFFEALRGCKRAGNLKHKKAHL